MKKYQVIIFTDLTDTVLTVKPLGAYRIANELRQNGYSCLVIDHFSRWNLNEITELISLTVDSNTLFVGFSSTFFMDVPASITFDPTKTEKLERFIPNNSFCPQGKAFETAIVNKIKSINNECRIVVGGHKITEHCSNKNIDVVVKGLAEVSVVTLANNLKNKKTLENSFKNIWGIHIVYKEQEKEYDFANTSMKWEYTDVLNTRVLPLEPARGCIFNCKFCSFPQRGKKTLDYVIDEELLYTELKTNYENFGITTYQLLDDTFNDSDEKLERILRVVKRLNFQPIFWAYARLDLLAVKPERIQKMYDIGVRATSFGIETLLYETGKLIGKGFDREKQIETIKKIRNTYGNNWLMHGLFIVGLPKESISSVRETANRILTQDIPLHSAYFESLFIARMGRTWLLSEFDKNWKEYGYRDLNPDSPDLIINWENEFMNRSQATEVRYEINSQLSNNNYFHLPGQTAWSLMNYPDFTLNYIQTLKNSEVDWSKITVSKKKFVEEYKNLLLSYLYNQN